MPKRYIIEMACDFIGAGKAYNNVSSDKSAPLIYWDEKINKTFITENTQNYMRFILTNYKKIGRLF